MFVSHRNQTLLCTQGFFGLSRLLSHTTLASCNKWKLHPSYRLGRIRFINGNSWRVKSGFLWRCWFFRQSLRAAEKGAGSFSSRLVVICWIRRLFPSKPQPSLSLFFFSLLLSEGERERAGERERSWLAAASQRAVSISLVPRASPATMSSEADEPKEGTGF